jgi:hypothetical protein
MSYGLLQVKANRNKVSQQKFEYVDSIRVFPVVFIQGAGRDHFVAN